MNTQHHASAYTWLTLYKFYLLLRPLGNQKMCMKTWHSSKCHTDLITLAVVKFVAAFGHFFAFSSSAFALVIAGNRRAPFLLKQVTEIAGTTAKYTARTQGHRPKSIRPSKLWPCPFIAAILQSSQSWGSRSYVRIWDDSLGSVNSSVLVRETKFWFAIVNNCCLGSERIFENSKWFFDWIWFQKYSH